MELTKSEIEVANRYISKREKQLAQWPMRRWLMLAIFLAMALYGYRNLSVAERDIQDDKATDLEVSRSLGDGPPPGLERLWMMGAIRKTAKVLELRYQVVTYALIQVAMGYVVLLGGACMVALTIVRWNTGERDALICKLLRTKLQELEQGAAPNSRPPPQSPALPDVRSSDSLGTTSSGGCG
jgi:hypothetical protein